MTLPKRLVFIAGFPRSGTTYFSNLFNSHEEVIYRHEVLGRCWKRFPGTLFSQLKQAGGLSDEEHRAALTTILSAHFEADRPPFFRKTHLRIRSTGLKRALWLSARTTRGLSPLLRAGPIRTDARHQGNPGRDQHGLHARGAEAVALPVSLSAPLRRDSFEAARYRAGLHGSRR